MNFTSVHFRVVVVDDDASVLSTMVRMLERVLPSVLPDRPTPLSIVSTDDAVAGKSLIEQTENGILITDIDLVSHLNGFDLAEAASHLPVIMVTGALDRHLPRIEALQQARAAAGSQGLWYLSKPFGMAELASTLKALT